MKKGDERESRVSGGRSQGARKGRDKPLEVDGKGRPSLGRFAKGPKSPRAHGHEKGEARDNKKDTDTGWAASLPACLLACLACNAQGAMQVHAVRKRANKVQYLRSKYLPLLLWSLAVPSCGNVVGVEFSSSNQKNAIKSSQRGTRPGIGERAALPVVRRALR